MQIEDNAPSGVDADATPVEPEFIGGTESGVEKSTPAEPDAKPEPEEEAKPEGEAKAEADEPEKPKQTPWFQKRIDELTRARYDAQRELEAARAEVARLKQPADENQPEQKPAGIADIERLANEKAMQIAAQREFDATCNTVYEDGAKAYGKDFDDALGNFRMLGGLPPALVEAAVETQSPARVLFELGKNPEEASRIMGLPPIKMASAVARLAAKPAPAAPPVSKAPTPIKPIVGSGKVETDPTKMSMAEWEKKFPLPTR